MLRIKVEGKQLDLSPKTEITMVYTNPMLEDEGIPVQYSLTYTLPLSPSNRMALGFPDRVTSKEGFSSRPCEISFAGINIGVGEQKIEEVAAEVSAHFTGANFPENIRKYLQYQDMGGAEIGAFQHPNYIDSEEWKAMTSSYNDMITIQTISESTVIAPPIALRPEEWPDYGSSMLTFQVKANFVNLYTAERGYFLRDSGYDPGKILFSFQIGWLLNNLLGDKLEDNPFQYHISSPRPAQKEWYRLYLLSMWHPKYNIIDNEPVWDVDWHNTRNVTITYADFLPAIPANTFIREILKLPCASMFIRGNDYAIEYNKDILARTIVRDWSDKIIDFPRLSLEKGREYIYGYSGDYGTVSDTLELTPAKSIRDMYVNSGSASDLLTYKVDTTGQVIEAVYDTDSQNKCKFTILQQDMGGSSEKSASGEGDDDIQSYDNVFNGCVPMTNLRRYFLQDHPSGSTNAKLKRFYYMPEVDVIGGQRPENLTVGLFWGIANNIVFDEKSTPRDVYPYMSHCNYDAYGNRLGDLSLQFGGVDGLLNQYHKEFKEWVERDKRILKAHMILTASDLNQLDLRDKFYIKGKLYYIRTLSVTLTSDRILPSEVEFVEV